MLECWKEREMNKTVPTLGFLFLIEGTLDSSVPVSCTGPHLEGLMGQSRCTVAGREGD